LKIYCEALYYQFKRFVITLLTNAIVSINSVCNNQRLEAATAAAHAEQPPLEAAGATAAHAEQPPLEAAGAATALVERPAVEAAHADQVPLIATGAAAAATGQEPLLHPVLHDAARHLWEEADRGQLERLAAYFSYRGWYICPNCQTMIQDFNEFRAIHHNAAAFRQRKRDMFDTISAHGVDLTAQPQHVEQIGHGVVQLPPTDVDIRVLSGLRNACVALEFTPHRLFLTIRDLTDAFAMLMRDYIVRNTSADIKIQLSTLVRFKQAADHSQTKSWTLSTAAQAPESIDVVHFNAFLQSKAQVLDEKIINYSQTSSGWITDRIIYVSLVCSRYVHLCRLQGRSYIPTPELVARKHCTTNVQNNDNKCFLYSILAYLKRNEVTHHRYRVQKYRRYLSELKFSERDLPMKICDISKFERDNPQLAINVIKFNALTTSEMRNAMLEDDDDDDIDTADNETMTDSAEDLRDMFEDDEEEEDETPTHQPKHYLKHPCFDLIYRSRFYSREVTAAAADVANITFINLLLLTEKNQFHYVAITDLNKLLNCHPYRNGCANRIRGYVCETCLRIYRQPRTLAKHKSICLKVKLMGTLFTLPEKDSLEFSDWSKMIPPKFIAYADFESILEPQNELGVRSTTNREIIQTHKPVAAAFLMLKPNGNQYEEFFGLECVVDFLTRLEIHAKRIKMWYDQNSHVAMQLLTTEQQNSFNRSNVCYMCTKMFTEGNSKVREHDHFSGSYLGAACSKCNFARRIKKPFLPVAFHNLKGYDMHHILKHAVSQFKHWELQCIPQSSEKFLSLVVYIKNCVTIRFIDTLQFLPSSLSNLANLLEAHEKAFTNSLNELPWNARSGKGIFPYSFATSVQVLEEDRQSLPPIEAFNDALAGGSLRITSDQYETAKQIWESTECTKLRDYLMLYLKVDIHLLADVFEKFRSTALEQDKLDPANYFSIPGFSWAAALKMMPHKIDLLQDMDMYEFFEAGIRGGMTFVNRHYAVKDENVDLLYVDVNNLYGGPLRGKLPSSNFQWVSDVELRNICTSLPDDNADIGYLLEIDFVIPTELHDKLSDLPPAPCSQKPPGSSVPKLLLTLENKQNYIVLGSLLKFYIDKLGVRVTKVHRAIQFQQSEIFRRYIDENTSKRAQASSKFLKDYYKLKNNSLYGKTVENLRKRKDIRLCNRKESFITYASRPLFKKAMQIDQNLVAALLTKETICLNRPVYIGQAVLDLSKLRMYKLQYEELERYRNLFPGSQITILAGDTDSFFLEVKNLSLEHDLLPKMKEDGLLDTSNYPNSSALYSKDFENKIGLIKDESCGKEKFLQFVFLRPKCYSMLSNSHESHRAKGISKATKLTHKQYLDIYQSYNPHAHMSPIASTLHVPQYNFISLSHQLYTIVYNKQALSIMDDKRVWLSRNFSVPYGHYAADIPPEFFD